MKMFGVSGMFQDFSPVSPGDEVNASLWIMNAGFDPMGPVGGGFIKLEWLGTPDFVESTVIDASTPLDTWTEVTLSEIAPAGATGVRFVAFCNLPSGGAAMFDNASLSIGSTSGTFGDITTTADPGVCGADIEIGLPAGTDNCGITSVTNDFNGTGDASGFYPVGTTTVTFTATDAAGNSTTCSIDVTVTDDEAAVITCPADVTLECPADTDPSATGVATAVDNCDPDVDIASSDVSTAGCGATESIVRTWTATDDVGNVGTCVQSIIVEDNTAPSIDVAASDLTVECDGAGNLGALAGWLATNGGAVASDICGSVTWSNTFGAITPDCGLTGSATVTFTATDDCGNSTSTAATFTIEDTTPPDLVVPSDVTIECTESSDPSNTGEGAGSDICSASGGTVDIAFISEIHYDNASSDVGEFIEVTGTAGFDLTGFSLVLYNGSTGAT